MDVQASRLPLSSKAGGLATLQGCPFGISLYCSYDEWPVFDPHCAAIPGTPWEMEIYGATVPGILLEVKVLDTQLQRWGRIAQRRVPSPHDQWSLIGLPSSLIGEIIYQHCAAPETFLRPTVHLISPWHHTHPW